MSKKKLDHYNSPMSRSIQTKIWHREICNEMTDEQYDDALMKMYNKYLLTWDEQLDYSEAKYTSITE